MDGVDGHGQVARKVKILLALILKDDNISAMSIRDTEFKIRE
jgi:hypothetical protein